MNYKKFTKRLHSFDKEFLEEWLKKNGNTNEFKELNVNVYKEELDKNKKLYKSK